MRLVALRPDAILATMSIVARGPGAGLARLAAAVVVLSLLGAACSPGPTASPSGPLATGPVSSPIAAAPTCDPFIPPVTPPAWWTDTTFYEVFVRSFADANGDGIGDLDGLTAHLDYLSALGVGALWLMPIAESGSYHGYDVIDYRAVEQDYGDAAAFQRLLAAAHSRGIRVIVDFVINHTSDRNPWFTDALAGGSHHDWYLWSDTDPGWPGPVGGNPWHQVPTRTAGGGNYYYGVFSDHMPDLNLANQAVTDEIDSIARFWLNDMGVDGFRIDAAPYLIEDGKGAQINTPETYAWLAAFRATIEAARGDAMDVGEVWQARAISSKYVNQGSLDMAFDFGIGPAILNAVQGGDATSLVVGEAEVADRYTGGPAGTFLSNHDQVRSMTSLKGDLGAAKEAAAVLLTGPGVPFIYYGEELGLTGEKPDEHIRRPFPWTATGPGFGFTTGTPWEAIGDGAAVANVAAEAADPTSLLSTYRELITLRAAHSALSRGSFVRVDASSSSVAAGLRVSPDEKLLVVQNLRDAPASGVTFDLDAGLCGTPAATVVYPATLAGPTTAPALTGTGGFTGYLPLPDLPPRAVVVISLAP
jgi:alpha-amylase